MDTTDTERGAPTLTTDTATDSVLALLPTPELPLPTLPGLPRVSTVLSDTTTVRGAPMPMPTTATATDTVLES